jgi:hypothetical protein
MGEERIEGQLLELHPAGVSMPSERRRYPIVWTTWQKCFHRELSFIAIAEQQRNTFTLYEVLAIVQLM